MENNTEILPYSMEDINFSFTKDERLLSDYFRVRDAVYLEYFKLPTADIIHDEYDKQDYTEFLIVRDKGVVIGGARIIYHMPGANTLLPFEAEDFLLKNVFPDLHLPQKKYCEVDRTVLLRPYRHGELGREVVRKFACRCKDQGAEYIFGIGPMIQNRNYKRHCHVLGIDFHILKEIDIPDRPAFNQKKMWLSITDLKYPIPSAQNLFEGTDSSFLARTER